MDNSDIRSLGSLNKAKRHRTSSNMMRLDQLAAGFSNCLKYALAVRNSYLWYSYGGGVPSSVLKYSSA